MVIDFVKMKSARDRRALTQEALAHQARVNVRTIQRAENGEPIRHETLQDIAAVLGVPAGNLIKDDDAPREENAEPDSSQMQMLKRVESGETVIAALERAMMSVLDCTAAPTEKNMPVLRAVIGHLEPLLRGYEEHEPGPPLRFTSLLQRLEAVAALNAQLSGLEREGLALYSGASTELVKIPQQCYEGWSIYSSQKPEYVMAARFLIAEYQADRIRVSRDVLWPLKIEQGFTTPTPWSDDLDDDIPF